jgi:hypothetical protein
MQLRHLTAVCGLFAGPMLAAAAFAAALEDPFIALRTNVPGQFTYVKRTEIEALSDVSPSHCVLLLSPGTLFSPRKDIRAFENCGSILAKLQGNTYTAFPADFGKYTCRPKVS